MKSTLFWVIRARLFHYFVSFLRISRLSFIFGRVFLPGHCRSFTSRKNTDLLAANCRRPEEVLAPSAEGVITFGDLAFVCRFGKIKFHSLSVAALRPYFLFHSLFFAIRPNQLRPGQSLVRPDFCLKNIWLRNFKKGKCQFTEILRCPESMSIYRDFAQILRCPENVHFSEILWCLVYVNIQRFCLDFMVPRVLQFTEILLRFYGASSMSVYRDFTMPWVRQFTEILLRFYGALSVNLQRFYSVPSMSIYRDLAEISWCAEYVNLKRFYDASSMSIYRDFTWSG